MTSMISDVPKCRICHDDADGHRLIAPCRCKGSSKWVHRNCLDVWRSSPLRDDVFDACEVCQAKYEFAVENPEVRPEEEPKRVWRFRLYMVRDVGGAVLATYALIVLLHLLIWGLDYTNSYALVSILRQRTTLYNEFGIYHLFAFLTFFAAIGFVGALYACCGSGARHLDCYCVYCGGGPSCDCGGGSGGGDGDGAAICFVIVAVIVVMFAALGLVIGMAVASSWVRERTLHHSSYIWNRQRALKYVVKDLSCVV
jgi:hypothetical protein